MTAQFSSPDEAGIVSVSFRAGKIAVADDTVPPFEAPIPESALRSELPDKAATVTPRRCSTTAAGSATRKA